MQEGFGGLTYELFWNRLSVIILLVVGLGIGTLLLEVALYYFFSRLLKLRNALAYTLLAPAVIALAAFTVYPLAYNVLLAFSDLRIKTMQCYMPPSTRTGECPLEDVEAGLTVSVALDKITLRAEPSDSAQAVVDVARGASLNVVQKGAPSSAAQPSSGSGAGSTSSGGFDLGGGVTLPGQATPVAPAVPPQQEDKRVWWQVKTSDGKQGWLPATVMSVDNKELPTMSRPAVLYSLEYGLNNFRDVFFDVDATTGQILGWGRLIRTEGSTFPILFTRTVLWTVLNVIFHLLIGFGLALVLNTNVRFKGVYRLILLIPWAIPQVIAALTWRTEFHVQYGFVNQLLGQFGIQPVSWLSQPLPAFIAVLFVNIWLGVPFYIVVLLGGLGSISREYYEAAEMDGANVVQKFRNITVPLIRPIAAPLITLDAVWTFNMFNVIYLITEGEPNESTNILVTAIYNAAFGRNGTFRLGFAAAFSMLVFLLLLGLAVLWIRSSGALKGVYD